MDISLTGPEKFVLGETLEKAINELLMEIARTDNRKLREELKEREEVLKAIAAKVHSISKSAA
ncbi:MAG: hypothetical protein HZB86_09040 [Deltaproteobacteria bacterium]|nr:hypothetical protein [Deltaproteobacteria bacterium]